MYIYTNMYFCVRILAILELLTFHEKRSSFSKKERISYHFTKWWNIFFYEIKIKTFVLFSK